MNNDILSVRHAQKKLLEKFATTEPVSVPLLEALGMVVTDNVRAPFDIPRFANSSMDGFAARSRDIQTASLDHPIVLQVIGDIPAGNTPDIHVGNQQAARIMTGAMVPEGADCVVPVEFTNIDWTNPNDEFEIGAVAINKPVQSGDFIRKVGEDITQGEVVLTSRLLRPADIGFLAMLGIGAVTVNRRPRVALFSSGDELMEPGEDLQAGKIFDANSYTLRALIHQAGAECIWLGIVADQKTAVLAALDSAVNSRADVIISTAGVSVGVFDFIRIVLEEAGKIHFWKVDMRPGKPLAFGEYQDVPFIGLPGNPVSAFVGFEVFVRPVIRKLLGSASVRRNLIHAVLTEPIDSDGRESYLRAVIDFRDGQWYARLTGHQGSGNLHSLVEANALLIVPSGVKSLPVGADIEAWVLPD
jgi:molybdopterin molybdotransferase